jgi:16S rRNA processing protein RimM
MKRSDAKLPEGTWFIQELIDCTVIDADDENKVYGILSDVSETGANDVWHIKQGDKEYLIPAIPPVVISTDVVEGIIKIRPLKGIFDNEN